MPAVSFSIKRKADLVRTGQCIQTIRLPRKRPWKARTPKGKGDTIYLYWKMRTPECRKLGEGEVISVQRKQFQFITVQEFLNDGFDSYEQAWHWFMNTYKSRIRKFAKQMKISISIALNVMEFDIIRWQPTKWNKTIGEQ